jgi:hypothetical protein
MENTPTKSSPVMPQLIILTLFWVGLQLVATWVKDDFSHVSQYISEINATGSTAAGAFGWVGFIPLAMVSFGVLLTARPHLRVKGISHIGWSLLFFYPVAYLGAAMAPCDLGCPTDGSSSQALHNIISMVSYFGFALGTLLLTFTPKTTWPVRFAFVFLSVIIALGFVLMINPELAEVRGAIQRYIGVAQLVVFWLLLWLKPAEADGGSNE